MRVCVPADPNIDGAYRRALIVSYGVFYIFAASPTITAVTHQFDSTLVPALPLLAYPAALDVLDDVKHYRPGPLRSLQLPNLLDASCYHWEYCPLQGIHSVRASPVSLDSYLSIPHSLKPST